MELSGLPFSSRSYIWSLRMPQFCPNHPGSWGHSFGGSATLPSHHTNKRNAPRVLHSRNPVIPAWSNVRFTVLFVAVHLGRRLSGKHDPGSRRRVALRSVPPAQCPLGPHFPVSPTPALGPKTALFSGSLFHLAERAEEPPPSSPSFPGGRAGRSGEVFEGPGEAPGRLCDRLGLSRSLLRRRGASSPAPAFPGRAGPGRPRRGEASCVGSRGACG